MTIDFSREHPLDPETVAGYRRDGFALLRGVFAPDELAPVLPRIRQAWAQHKLDDRPLAERDTYGRAFTQALHLGLRDRDIFRFAYGRRFARLAAELMGVSAVRMFLDEAFFKEPGSGPTPWHQDQAVWPFDARAVITLWVPLLDVTPEMGTLTFAAGSHRARQLTGADISDESEQALDALIRERGFSLRSIGALAFGDVSAHDGFMVHRAGSNQTNVVREVYAMHFFSDGACVVEPDNEARRRILERFGPGLRPGDPAASRYWRRVYPVTDPLLEPIG